MAVTTVATVPQQQALAVQQAEEGDLGKIAATRFEIVLNQIDNAKARVRHEKQQLQQFQRVVEQEQNSAEPNALTEEGMKVPEYDEKPPGDDDQGNLGTQCVPFDFSNRIPFFKFHWKEYL